MCRHDQHWLASFEAVETRAYTHPHSHEHRGSFDRASATRRANSSWSSMGVGGAGHRAQRPAPVET